MRTNAWLTVENNLAISWWNWLQWFASDQTDPEPALSDWDKKALTRLVDMVWSFQAFKKADLLGKTWRMMSVYDVTHGNIEAGFNQHGEATEGGNLGIAGFWEWNPGDAVSALSDVYPWYPNNVLKFMPDQCANADCSAMEPATEILQISLLMGQPWREIPQDGVDQQALVAFMIDEGWDATVQRDVLILIRNGKMYRLSGSYLRSCAFDSLPAPLINDLKNGLLQQGILCA